MSRTSGGVVALLLIALGAFFPALVRAQGEAADVRVTQVDTSDYPEVTIYVAAEDANGQPRSGLTRNDFAITEDGSPVDIIRFEGGGKNLIHTALIIDSSGSMDRRDKLRGAQDAASTFIDMMQPGDKTTLIAFSEDPEQLTPLTDSADTLNRSLLKLRASGSTALYDSIFAGVDALKEVGGRTVLLVLTDGRETEREGGLDDAIDYANRYGQPVYIVGLGERNRSGNEGIDETVLQRIAVETHGEYFYTPRADQLVDLYNRLSYTLHEEYVISYHSPRPFYDGTRRDIQVQVGTVQSRGAYTEQHLINVQSRFLVGVLLLVPLLVLLMLPTLVQRLRPVQKQPSDPVGQAKSIPIVTASSEGATTYTSNVDDARPDDSLPDNATTPASDSAEKYCTACGQALRSTARFCGKCGTRQSG